MRRAAPWVVVLLLSVVAGCGLGVRDPATTTSTAAAALPAPTTASRPPPTTTAAPTATTTTAVPTTTTTAAPLPPITVVVAGDTSFTHGLDARDPLGDVAPLLGDADLSILNVETVIAEEEVGEAIEKVFVFKSPPGSAGILAGAGVDVAALANNHALDYGRDGVLRTVELLEGAGVATAGTGDGPDEAYAAVRVRVDGWRVAVLSFTRVPCDRPEPGESFIPEVAWACPEHVEATVDAVTRAARRADLVVVMAHWGVERNPCPEPHQIELGRLWGDAGADLVVGSHPHVLQGVERIGEAWLLHSTGNFAFPSAREASSYTAAFRFDVAEDGIGLSAVPLRIVDGRPVPAESSRDAILADLTARSFGVAFDPDGTAVPADASGAC